MRDGEYAGRVESAAMSGDAVLYIGEESLVMSSLFDVHPILYRDITALAVEDYAVKIATERGEVKITRLGSACEPFFSALRAAYDGKVRRALFVTGKPLLRTAGEYRRDEGGTLVWGSALIEVYENCVLLLPPDDGARRVPLCFLSGMEEEGFALTLALDTGERYSFLRLGRDTGPFAECVRERLHALREKAVRAAGELDGSLDPYQRSAIARLMPEGAAAPLRRLHEIAPSFIRALERKIADSRVAEEYQVFKAGCDPMEICVGVKSGLAGEEAESVPWLIAPGAQPGVAAAELATSEENAATFVYRGFSDWAEFRRRLNQAMEAVDFRREAIRLTDDELNRPEHANWAMAVKRNGALRFLRAHFAGRIVHSSPEGWRKRVILLMQSNHYEEK